MFNSDIEISKKFERTPVNPDWCFKNVRSTEQWTHGYHRYPAKFLPNLVQKLIEEYTEKDDLIADLFAGCGTTLVEAKVHGRRSIGVDINPVAKLIARVKTRPIKPVKLEDAFCYMDQVISRFDASKYRKIAVHKRIDYWFSEDQKRKIAFLLDEISALKGEVKEFFQVALSNILKNCSRWLQTSTKPQIDPNKKPTDVFIAFRMQVRQMIKKNNEFYTYLIEKKFEKTSCEIKLQDARKTSITSNSVAAIITSPPYVTSYEYADIHQLSGFWFEYFSDLSGFRKRFIGSFYSLKQEITTKSVLGQQIVNELIKKDKRTAKEVANYFNDLSLIGREMFRIIKPEGHACIVIGNTEFLGVKIKSAEVFTEVLIQEGFLITDVIKRSIPNKLIPTIRDKKSGRFTTLELSNSQKV